MKKQNIIILSVLLGLVVFSCVRDWLNPYDSDCPPEVWSPEDLTVEKVDDGILLTWQQYEKHFDGFTLERSPDSTTWKSINPQLIAKTDRDFTDTIYRPGEVFYYRIVAVADKNLSNYSYSSVFNFPTELPVVRTVDITDLKSTEAKFLGSVVSDGGEEVTERGFCYDTEEPVDTSNIKVEAGTGLGDFSAVITGLLPGQTYFMKAYAVNNNGIVYGEQKTFNTSASLPQLTISDAENVTSYTAEFDAEITDDGGAQIVQNGFCYIKGTDALPDTINNNLQVAVTDVFFGAIAENLEPGTTYTVRAYAVNIAGINYSDTIRIKTPPVLPDVVTIEYEEVTLNSSVLRGKVQYNGGTQILEYGFVWSTNSDPTIEDNIVSSNDGSEGFDETITGLEPGTDYYFKAYAKNSVGISYGDQLMFTTQSGIALVKTYTVKNITATNATISGQVLDDGGAEILENGFYVSTDSANILSTTPEVVPISFDTLSIELTTLEPGMEYFFVAFASNSQGTSYGNILKFRTDCKDCIFGTMTGPGGKTYKTIKLGNQIWMAENLAYLPNVAPYTEGSKEEPFYYVPNYKAYSVSEAKNTKEYQEYGVWYNWPAANKLQEVLDANEGWRLPSDDDWKKLEAFLGMTEEQQNGEELRGTNEGIKLKYCWDWESSEFRGTNETCFTALAVGGRATIEIAGSQVPIGEEFGAGWWSSTTRTGPTGTFAFWRGLFAPVPNIYRIDSELDFGLSVRLVKDAE